MNCNPRQWSWGSFIFHIENSSHITVSNHWQRMHDPLLHNTPSSVSHHAAIPPLVPLQIPVSVYILRAAVALRAFLHLHPGPHLLPFLTQHSCIDVYYMSNLWTIDPLALLQPLCFKPTPNHTLAWDSMTIVRTLLCITTSQFFYMKTLYL